MWWPCHLTVLSDLSESMIVSTADDVIMTSAGMSSTYDWSDLILGAQLQILRFDFQNGAVPKMQNDDIHISRRDDYHGVSHAHFAVRSPPHDINLVVYCRGNRSRYEETSFRNVRKDNIGEFDECGIVTVPLHWFSYFLYFSWDHQQHQPIPDTYDPRRYVWSLLLGGILFFFWVHDCSWNEEHAFPWWFFLGSWFYRLNWWVRRMWIHNPTLLISYFLYFSWLRPPAMPSTCLYVWSILPGDILFFFGVHICSVMKNIRFNGDFLLDHAWF